MSFSVTSSSKGNAITFLEQLRAAKLVSEFDRFGKMGVDALSKATPIESGETARAWDYVIVTKPREVEIHWTNSHVNNGENIAILIQYGHGTGTGGYIPGKDYINPAIKPVFDQIIADIGKKVNRG